MNQEEEIEKQEKKIKNLESELHFAKEEFKAKYLDVQKQIDSMDSEYEKLYYKQEQIKMKVAAVLSSHPSRLKEGWLSELNEDIHQFGKSLNIDSAVWSHSYQNISWREYNKLFETVPEFKAIADKANNLVRSTAEVKQNSTGYIALTDKIRELERDIKWAEEHLKKLHDISYFRQHAKKIKQCEKENQITKENDEKIKIFLDWFNKNYVPKMKQTIIEVCKD